jgi:HK97 family phage major capsid protein
MRKALTVSTDSSGGYLVPPDVAADVLMGLRARSAVMRMGPTIVPLKKSLDVVSLSTGASAVYLAENAAIPISEQTFVQSALLTPKELAALVPVSDRLLRDADDNPSIEDVLRRDLSEVLALRADLAFLRGTGTGGEPRGIRNTRCHGRRGQPPWLSVSDDNANPDQSLRGLEFGLFRDLLQQRLG